MYMNPNRILKTMAGTVLAIHPDGRRANNASTSTCASSGPRSALHIRSYGSAAMAAAGDLRCGPLGTSCLSTAS